MGTNTQPDLESKKNYFSKHYILGYVFLFAVLAATVSVVYFLQISNQPINTSPIIHNPKTDQTAGWKTYTNDQYGFEVKYPADSFSVSEDEFSDLGIKTSNIDFIEKGVIGEGTEGVSAGIYIVIETDGKIKNINDLLNKINTEPLPFQEGERSPEDKFIFDKTKIAGYEAYTYEQPIGATITSKIVFFKSGLSFRITESTFGSNLDESIYNQILSSFKFIEPAKPVSQKKTSPPVVASAMITMDDFAKCLAAKKATMYGASWCPHCQNEKKTFGSAFQYVSYVECVDHPDVCSAAGVTGYPTWVLANGQKLVGEQNGDGFAKLAAGANCPLPSN